MPSTITHASPRIRTNPDVQIFFGRISSVSGIHVAGGNLHIAHQCAVMYTLADGDWQSMKTLSFTEFRKRASEILTLVEKGETVSIIRHGKTVAKIVPAETEEIPSWKQPVLRLVHPACIVQ